jgi:hypothetical protein
MLEVDTLAPTVTRFYANPTSADLYLTSGSNKIELLARFSEPVTAGAAIEVTLSTNAKVLLTASAEPDVLRGEYTVRPGDSSQGLDVVSYRIVGNSVADVVGNAMTSTDLPLENLVATSSIRVFGDIRASTSLTSTGFSSDKSNVSDKRVVVPSVTITFNTAVRGVSLSSFRLFLNDKPVSLLGASLKGSGANWTLTLPRNRASLKGIYELRILPAGITAIDGGARMSGTSSIFWGYRASTSPAAAFRRV